MVEVRSYQNSTFGFAARICSPATTAARWRAPGLAVLELYPEETEHLYGCSLETTDERLLRWLLRHAETRGLLDDLRDAAAARSIEVLLAGSIIVVRGLAPVKGSAGEAMEFLGPPLVEALRALSTDLHDLATALADVGDESDVSAPCGGCGAGLDDDPWLCPDCGSALHRGCREMVGGCATLGCARAPDALPGVVAPVAEAV